MGLGSVNVFDGPAAGVTYDNTTSGLTATNAQAAIDELSVAKPLIGGSDPTTSTAGRVGQHYINTTDGTEWTCVAADTETPSYTWVEGGGGSGGTLVLSALRISAAPTKTAYKAGEIFDPTGMTVVADYTMNGVTIVQNVTITGYSCPTGTLAAGTTSVTITYTEGGVTKTATQAITCTKTDVDIPSYNGSNTYDGSSQTPSITDEPSVTYASKSGDTSGTDADDYELVYTLTDTDLYQWSDGTTTPKTVQWSIGKVTPTVTAPTKAADMTYNGSSRNLLTSAGSTDFGTLEYSTDGSTWSAGEPTEANAGEYTIRYRVVGDSNINDVAGASIGKVTINKKAVTISVDPASVTLDPTNLTATATVTTDGDGTFDTPSSSDSSVATATISNKVVTISHVNRTTGTATITITQNDGANYIGDSVTVAVTASFVSSTLNDNSWAVIKDVSDADQGDDYWDVGDTKTVTINGTVQGFTFSNLSVQAFIIGFNHNSAKEGAHRIHFLLGKISGTDVAFCDSDYNNTGSGNGFRMNKSNTNSGGWNGSYMRKTVLGNDGTPSSPASGSFMAALPSDLRAVMKSVTKYTDNTGNASNTSGAVTATTDYLFLPAEFEVFGTRTGANQYEQNSQAHYAYFSANNTNAKRVAYKHSATSASVYWWLRSAYYYYSNFFRYVFTDGSANSNNANYSEGLRVGFAA